MTNLTHTSKQLPLDFEVRNYMGRDDFMVSACNREAFELLDSWPHWLSFGAVIYGPKGSGKSHLARIFADKARNLHDKPKNITIIEAKSINMHNVKRLFEKNEILIVENLTADSNNEALFHLFNLFNTPEHWILFTAEKAPAQMKFALRDLQSRLNMLPCAAIAEPDDLMLQMLIVKLFDDRQLKISPGILQYIINNAPRSFDYVEQLIVEIDEISLAYQTSVTYSVVRKAMSVLAERNQREPDLFDDFLL